MTVSIRKKELGDLIQINNPDLTVVLSNLGARILKIYYPDRQGSFENLVLGYEFLDLYLENIENLSGATVGFNENQNLIHTKENNEMLSQGIKTQEKLFSYRVLGNDSVEFFAEIVPGQEITITFKVTRNSLSIKYQSDKVNLFNHSYFTLGGHNIESHDLKVAATSYCPIDRATGTYQKASPVAKTVFDFNDMVNIDKALHLIRDEEPDSRGLDHLYLLKSSPDQIVLENRSSNRMMTISTTATTCQIYTGNFLPSLHEGISFLFGGPAGGYEVSYKFDLIEV